MRKYRKKNALKIFISVTVCALICGLLFSAANSISDFLYGDNQSVNNQSNNISQDDNHSSNSEDFNDIVYLTDLDDLGGIKIGNNTGSGRYSLALSDYDSGKFHILIVDKDGFVFARGSNEWQQLGLNGGSSYNAVANTVTDYTKTDRYYTYWQSVVALNHVTVTKVAAGGYHSLAIGYDSSGNYRVFAWGRQGSGRLGNGTTNDTASSGVIDITNKFNFESGDYPIDVEAGEHHSMLLTNKGYVYTWGENARGQLGSGNTTDSSTPVKITGGSLKDKKIVEISAGSEHSLARDSSNKLHAWGDNTRYQCGLTGSYYTSPQAIQTSYTFSQISAGELHNVGRRTTGNLVLWGDGRGGKLGNGNINNTDDNKSTAVSHTTRTYTDVAAGGANTLALDSSGNVWVTGFGTNLFFNVSYSGSFVDSQKDAIAISNGGMMFMITSNHEMYYYGYAAKYGEHWYGLNPIPVVPGTSIQDTSIPYPTYNVVHNTSDNIKRLAPISNIIGLPTDYNRASPQSTVPTDNIIFYNTRVKINCFYSSYSEFKIAQVTSTIYNNNDYNNSSIKWKTINAKGAIVDREGYYFVKFRMGSSTSGTLTNRKFTIANKSGPEVALSSDNSSKCIATIKVYDGFGLSKVQVAGTASVYDSAQGKFVDQNYDVTHDISSSTYSTTIEIPRNSKNTFKITATDSQGKVFETNLVVNTVVSIIATNLETTYDGTTKAITPQFHTPARGTFSKSQFQSYYSGYTISDVYYSGGRADFTPGTSPPKLASASAYSAYTAIKKGSSTIIDSTVSIKINKRNLTVTAAAKQKVYGNSDPALTYTYSGLATGDSFTGNLTRVSGENAGTYAINRGSLNVTNSDCYNFTYNGANLTISKRTVSIKADNKSKIYGDNDPALTFTVTSTYNLASGDKWEGALTRDSGQTVGTYAIKQGNLTVDKPHNYTINFTQGTFTISQRSLTVSAAAKEKTYGNPDPELTYSITGGSLASGDGFTGSLTRTSGENAGTYTINQGTLKVTNSNCYNFTFKSATFKINPRAVTVEANDAYIDYGDNPPSYSVTYENLVSGDNPGHTATCSYVKGNNAGTYDITVNAKTHQNYTFTYVKGTLHVSKIPVYITPNHINITYGDTLPAVTFEYDGLLSGDTLSPAPSTYIVDSTGNPYNGNAGMYYIRIHAQTYTNYVPSYGEALLNVARANAVITAAATQEKVYDGATQYPDATLNHNECSLTFSQGYRNVGTYSVTISSARTTNYEAASKTVTFKITPRPLTVTANNITKVYGEFDPILTYTYQGLVQGDMITGSLVRDSGNNVGTYTIRIGSVQANNNYALTFVEGVFTIIRRPITITAHPKEKIYGELDPQLTYGITQGDIAFGDYLSGDLVREPGDDAGTYQIGQGTLTNANNSNYDITFESATFTIRRRNIIITANPAQKIYGDPEPPLTYYISQGELVGSDQLQGSLARQMGIDVGTYAITQGTLINDRNPNYDIVFVPSSLVIHKRPLTVKAKDLTIHYGDTPQFEIEYINIAYNDAFTDEVVTDYRLYDEVGLYTINVVQREYVNYEPEYVAGVLTVEKRPITVKADNKEITFGQAPPQYTITYINTVNNDQLTDIVSCAYSQYGDAGEYDITVTPNEYANYVATYQKGVLKVKKKEIVITPIDKVINYGEQPPQLEVEITGLIAGYEVTAQAQTAYRKNDNAGEYDITVIRQEYVNYAPVDRTGTLTVLKKALTVIADDKHIIYGQAPPQYTVSYIGLAEGDYLEDTAVCDYQRYDDTGEYEITVVQREYENYQPTYVSGMLTVSRRDLIIRADNKTITYGDAPPQHTITYSDLQNNDNLEDTIICSYQRYDNAGEYAIMIVRKSYKNYNATYVDGVLTVLKKAITVKADDKEIIYGDDLPQFTFQYTGLVNQDTLTDTATTVYNRYDDTGEYAIKVTPREYVNYAATYIDGVLRVLKKDLVVIAEDQYIRYGSEVPEITFIFEGLAGPKTPVIEAYTTYYKNADVGDYPIIITTTELRNYETQFINGTIYVGKSPSLLIGDREQIHYYDRTVKYLDVTLNHDEAELVFTPARGYTEIGIYYITVSAPETENYMAISEVFTLVINKRKVFITAHDQSKVYGEADPELTYSYEGLFEGDTLWGELSRAPGEGAGSYDIIQHTLTASENYDLVFTKGTFVITPRPLTIKTYPESKVYGEADPVFRYDIIEGNLIGDDALSGALSREAGKDVGQYPINLGTLGNPNYALTLVSDYLTITPRTLTLSALASGKIYGEADPVLNYAITNGNLVYDDVLEDTAYRQAGEDVGEYVISINQVENRNYLITYEDNIFVISRRPITVQADSKQKVYGDDDVALTYTVIEGNLVFNDQLTGELVREEGLDKGVYAILQGSVTNDNNGNYDITYIASTYEITARPITLRANDASKIYGEADPELSYELIEGSLAYSDAIYGIPAREEGENAKTHVIGRGSLTNDNNENYDITFVNGVFTIHKRPITVEAQPYTKVYGYNEPLLDYDIIEGSLAFDDELVGSLDRGSNLNVGEYEITQGTLTNENNPNYDITYISAIFTIVPRAITITADYTVKSYGDNDPIITYKVTTGSLAYLDTLAGLLTREPGEARGEYQILQGSVNSENNPNYNISFVGNVFKIVERAITVKAISVSKIYGEADPELGYEITKGGTVFGETLVGELVRDEGENVGSYTIRRGTLINENNPNYIITFEENDFIIERRPLVITPNQASKTYGYGDPPLTYEITEGNLVFGDSLVGQLARTQGENVGLYLILHGTLNNAHNPNYDIILEEVYFEIEKRVVALIANSQSKIYGNPDPVFTYSVLGGEILEGDVLEGSLSREAGENVGVYAITAGDLNERNPNYELVVMSGNLIINSRPITIRANDISFLHGSQTEIEMSYTILGNPLPQDEELIAQRITITTPATPYSIVGKYPIVLHQTGALNNYQITLADGILEIIPGTITNVFFEDKSVLYDGYEHVLEATGDVDKYNVQYMYNKGVEVGIYNAIAVFTKENYNDLILTAKLIIMTNTITTSEIKPEGIVTIEEGVNPYVVPVIMQNQDADTLALAQSILSSDADEREIINKIVNISLYDNGQEINLPGEALIKLLIPENVDTVDDLRLVHLNGEIYDVPFTIEGDYIVFKASELGNYALIVTTKEKSNDSIIATALFYTGVGVLGLAVVGFLITGFTKRKKRYNAQKYV